MSSQEARARAEVRRIAQDLEAIRYRLLGIIGSLTDSKGEKELEIGAETETRAVLECVLLDYLQPAIRDLGNVPEDE